MLNWYRIDRILGRGGFGVIYLARDMNLDLDVAIKEYLPGDVARRADDSQVYPLTEEHGPVYSRGLERFIEEARTLVRFKHPNIVRVMSVFQQNNTAYMVMEFEEGVSFREHLATSPDAREEQSLKGLVLPIIEGLVEVHRHGFIHRDIKPSNILIRKDGTPVLIDFGSARNAGGVTRQNLTALVSAGYAPLEQYNDDDEGRGEGQQGPWTDIYALGGVLYHGVCAGDPVDSTRRASAVFNGGRDPLLPATLVGQGRYDDAFLRAIDWALSFRIADRPQSLNDWVPALLAGTRPSKAMPLAPGLGLGRGRQTLADAPTVLSAKSLADGIRPKQSVATRTRRFALFGGLVLIVGLAGVAGTVTWKSVSGGRFVSDREEAEVSDAKAPRESLVVAEARRPIEEKTVEEDAVELATPRRADENAADESAEVAAEAVGIEASRLDEENVTDRAVDRALETRVRRQADSSIAAVRTAEDEPQGLAEEKAAEQATEAEAQRLEQARVSDRAEDRAEDTAEQAETEMRPLAEVKAAKQAAEAERTARADEAVEREEQRLASAKAAEQAAEVEAKRLEEVRAAEQAAEAQRIAEAKAAQDAVAAEARRLAMAEAAAEAEKKRLDDEARQRAAEAAIPVSDADIASVMERFEILRRAIVRQEPDIMNGLTEPSSQNRLFEQLIDDFAELDVSLLNIRVRNADKSIVATLRIDAMIRSNGDRAEPSDAYRDRDITTSRRNGKWSAIRW